MKYRPMTLPGSTMNCSRKVPILLLERSIESSLKLGTPSGWIPSPHIRNWFPTINEPETLIATPSGPLERHCSFSTTWTSLSGGQSPANVLLMLDRDANMSFPPTDCFPEKLRRIKTHIRPQTWKKYLKKGIWFSIQMKWQIIYLLVRAVIASCFIRLIKI